MPNKKVAIIGTVGVPAKYGGFETLVEHLTRQLIERVDFTVYCSDKAYTEKLTDYNGARLVYFPLYANGLQSIPYDILSMIHAMWRSDAMLVLGVSGCLFLPFLKLFYRRPLIVNIDGLEWKRDKWNTFAKWFLKFSEKLATTYADNVVTDNKVIQEYVKTEYGKDSLLIAYGACHVEHLDLSKELLKQYDFLEKRYAFTVCRIEPENNLHIILEAIALQSQLPLLIIGNWSASQYGIELRAKYSKFDHIHLLDSIYDQNILNQMRSNCCVYLHGHSAGGTNPSLVEAMSLGLPIFAFGVDYNKETTEQSARYFSDAKELSFLIDQMSETELYAIGRKMAEIADRRYRWEMIAEQYASVLGLTGLT